MMNYEEFKELVTERLSELIRQDYPDIEVKEDSIPVHNHFEDTLLFSRQHDGMGVAPTLYFSQLYGNYIRSGEFEQCIHRCYLQLCEKMEFTEEVRKAIDDQSALEDRITFELMHTEQNRELLDMLPHREFQDLSIVYNCSFQTENLVGKARVTHQLAERLGISEENLYAFAYENTKKVHQPIVRPLEDVMSYVMSKKHEKINLEEIPEKDDALVPLYMLSNRENNRGAVSMLYPEELGKLADKLESDLYIMPASVDMVLITSTQDTNPETLAKIVYDMNCNELLLEERLSNQIYHYNRQTQEITLATNTEHTMLSEEPDQLENVIEPEEEEEGMSMGMGV